MLLPQVEHRLSGTITDTGGIDASQTTITLSEAPERLPTYLDIEPGTANFERVKVYSMAGSVASVERGIGNGGVGNNHAQDSIFKQTIAPEFWQDLVTAIQSGYINQPDYFSLTRVSDTELYLNGGDFSTYYTKGRLVIFNESEAVTDMVVSSSYDGVNNRTVILVGWGNVPDPLTGIGFAIGPRGNLDKVSDVTGVIKSFAGSAAPDGYLLCDGSAVSRTQYADLYAIVGDLYGAGDGVNTFNVPDARGRALVGLDATITDFNTLGKKTGSKDVILTAAQLAAHTHGKGTLATASAGSHQHNLYINTFNTFQAGGGTIVPERQPSFTPQNNWMSNAGDHTHTISGDTASAGSGSAHTNVQPSLVVNYIIKT